MKNKRGSETLMLSLVIFVVLNTAFLLILLGGVARAGESETILEETYSKQIALLIDGSKPGTKIEVEVSQLIKIAKDKNAEPIIELNCEKNEIFVKVTSSGGYATPYFTTLEKCDSALDLQKRKFIINT